ncbi:hypothetical protein KY285_017613 [Solanum tuberosum]|nr:hypothetical protein KY285_017613 [Solanum tuberosum]
MEIPQTFNEFKVWTDDFIIPNDNNLKTIINNPSTSPLFLIEIRVQEFVQYLSKNGDSIEENVTHHHRNLFMMSLPATSGRPLLPIVLLIAVNSWDPTPREN